MIRAILTAYRLVDAGTRRRVLISAPLAFLIATLEGGALALLVPVLQAATRPEGSESGALSWLGRLIGVTDPYRIQALAAGVVLGLLLAKSVLGVAFRWWQLGFLARSEEQLTVELFRRYLHAPYQFHVGRNSAEAIRNTDSAVNAVTRSVLVPATRMLGDGAQLIMTTIVVVAADPAVSLAIGVYFGAAATAYVRIAGPRIRRLGREGHRLNGTTLQRMQECLSGVKHIQAADAGDRMVARFDAERQALRHVRRRISFVTVLPRLYLEVAMVFGGILAALLLAGRPDQSAAVATIGLLLAAAFRTLPAVGQLLSSADSIRSAKASTEAVAAVMAELGDAPPVPETIELGHLALHEGIRALGLGYTYPDGRQALQNVSFEIRRGESIGIVGPSGAGKTTLVDLLLGLMTPTEGHLLIDGAPLTPDRVWAWRERVAYIPQEVFISDDTLRRNIAFGLDDAHIDDERILAAIDGASLADLVAQLPDGLDSSVGEAGLQLSGGQRQRVGIARALYREPEVLILDEATSALDNITENAVTGMVNRLGSDLTVITIAHRPSTVAGCDRLLLLEDGRLAADGPVEAVLAVQLGGRTTNLMATGDRNGG